MKIHLIRDEMWPVFDEIESDRWACLTVDMTEEELAEFRSIRDKFYAIQRKWSDLYDASH